MKPRLYRRGETWFCAEGANLGCGVTPKAAFMRWLVESLARFDF